MSDRYIRLSSDSMDDLLSRVNAIAQIPVTDEGWPTGNKPRFNLISVTSGSNYDAIGYWAILEAV